MYCLFNKCLQYIPLASSNLNFFSQKQPTKLSPAATSLTPKYFHGSEKDYYAMEKLSKLKKMYTPSPIRNRYGKPKFTTKRSEHSYYVYPTPKSNSNPYYQKISVNSFLK